MKLADLTWTDVEGLSREIVVVVPTGSLEQHGPHLPLLTDTLLVTAVVEAAERTLPDAVLVTPTHWLGASAHHMGFSGTMTATFGSYDGAITDMVESILSHGFRKVILVNGHGGNTSPNDVAMRRLKERHPSATLGAVDYYLFAQDEIAQCMEGPQREIGHACEAETSLMLHLHPHLVRMDRAEDDGLSPEPPVKSVIHRFDELTDRGPYGYATLATPQKGKRIFDAAVAGLAAELKTLAEGYVLKGRPLV